MKTQSRSISRTGLPLLYCALALFISGCSSPPHNGQGESVETAEDLEPEIQGRMQLLNSRMDNLKQMRHLFALGLTPSRQRMLDETLETLQKDPQRLKHAQQLLTSLRNYEAEIKKEVAAYGDVMTADPAEDLVPPKK